jgi:antibiotic biosynthesis monooxygenase (ABM) superfamily enzyme
MTEAQPRHTDRWSVALVVLLTVWVVVPPCTVVIALSLGPAWDEPVPPTRVRIDAVLTLLLAAVLLLPPVAGLLIALYRRRTVVAVLSGVAIAISVAVLLWTGLTPAGLAETVHELVTGRTPGSAV